MFWYDGQLLQGDQLALDIHDPGLLYGATVFTTLRIYNQSLDCPLTNWKAHCDRLLQSLQTFNWQLPDWNRLRQGAEVLLNDYPVLRMVVFADGREWIFGRRLPEDLGQRQQQGIIGWVADNPLYQRSLAAYKTGNYLGAWLALQKAQALGAKEAILTDNQGNWLETSTGNLWGWKEGCWWTPALEGEILPGIVRSQLLNWLDQQNLAVRENRWDREFVQGLEAIAYTNSVVEVMPFSQAIHLPEVFVLNPFHPALAQLQTYFQEEK
jgi:4-amino-4-deoxychorismate lyase